MIPLELSFTLKVLFRSQILHLLLYLSDSLLIINDWLLTIDLHSLLKVRLCFLSNFIELDLWLINFAQVTHSIDQICFVCTLSLLLVRISSNLL